MGTQLPPPQTGRSPLPNFRPRSIVAKWLAGSRRHLARRWALVRSRCARWGPSSHPQERGRGPPPQFSAYFYFGQMVGCINMPLGMGVGLSPSNFVSDGEPAPPQKGGGAPTFRPMSIAAKRLNASRWHLAWKWALFQATLC